MSKKQSQKEPTFEQALARLETIVEDIEQGRVGLAESIQRFEEGTRLIRHCQDILSQAELKIRELQAGPGGQPQAKPLSTPESEGDAAAGPPDAEIA